MRVLTRDFEEGKVRIELEVLNNRQTATGMPALSRSLLVGEGRLSVNET